MEVFEIWDYYFVTGSTKLIIERTQTIDLTNEAVFGKIQIYAPKSKMGWLI